MREDCAPWFAVLPLIKSLLVIKLAYEPFSHYRNVWEGEHS